MCCLMRVFTLLSLLIGIFNFHNIKFDESSCIENLWVQGYLREERGLFTQMFSPAMEAAGTAAGLEGGTSSGWNRSVGDGMGLVAVLSRFVLL